MTENEKHLQEWVKSQEQKAMGMALDNLEAEVKIIELKREFIPLWLEFHHQGNISVLDRLYHLAEELYSYGEGGTDSFLNEEIDKLFWAKHRV